MEREFKIECIICDVSSNNILFTIEESGVELSELMLKNNFKSSILNALKEKGISGELYVEMLVTKNDSYYDDDDFNIIVDEEFTECQFVY